MLISLDYLTKWCKLFLKTNLKYYYLLKLNKLFLSIKNKKDLAMKFQKHKTVIIKKWVEGWNIRKKF